MTASLRAAAALGFLAAVVAASGALAQTVYRCGADGRSYQTAPCSDGRPIDVSDARSDEQRRAAKEASASEARLAAQMERERRVREAATVPARAGGVTAAPAVQVASAPQPYGRRHARGVRYFADGTPVPPVYRAPAAPPQHRSR